MKTSDAANFVFQWIFVMNSVKHASSSMWVSLKRFTDTKFPECNLSIYSFVKSTDNIEVDGHQS